MSGYDEYVVCPDCQGLGFTSNPQTVYTKDVDGNIVNSHTIFNQPKCSSCEGQGYYTVPLFSS